MSGISLLKYSGSDFEEKKPLYEVTVCNHLNKHFAVLYVDDHSIIKKSFFQVI
jgi:hypothetical protein